MKRQTSSLAYLEQVRQHLSRLPSIDPATRTLLVTGFPNVGKSSFVNKITRADVEVQPYAFTTKSLFVGHTDYKYLRWQVIDTPGILDHSLEERNTIEMQAITALAHLRASVLYILDLSEQCGHTFAEQVSLFENIRPLFANKPMTLVVNKVDITTVEDLTDEQREVLQRFIDEGIELLPMSTLTEQGVMEVKRSACEKLLSHRVEVKMKGSKVNDVLNRLHLAMPTARDDKARPAFIPEGARKTRTGWYGTKGRTARQEADELRKKFGQRPVTLRDKQEELREEYSHDLRAHWDLANEEWRYDNVPEIVEGQNVADFIDPDIMEKLEALEAEEEAREAAGEYYSEGEDEETKQLHRTAEKIREKRAIRRAQNQMQRSNNARVLPANMRDRSDTFKMKHLKGKASAGAGSDSDDPYERMDERGDGARRARTRSRTPLRSRTREASESVGPRTRSQSRNRHEAGFATMSKAKEARELAKMAQRARNYQGKAGEADHRITTKMPKHLFSGKMGKGSRDRR